MIRCNVCVCIECDSYRLTQNCSVYVFVENVCILFFVRKTLILLCKLWNADSFLLEIYKLQLVEWPNTVSTIRIDVIYIVITFFLMGKKIKMEKPNDKASVVKKCVRHEPWIHFIYNLPMRHNGEMDSSLDWVIGELNSNSNQVCYIHLGANTVEKGMNTCILSQLW